MTDRRTYTARWIFPVESAPIEGGVVTVQEGLIAHVGLPDGRAIDVDYGDAAILPGFVNAHTHLELSALEGDAPGVVEDQVEWLGRVIRQRGDGGIAGLSANVSTNLRAAIAAGTTALADTTTAGLSWPALAAAPIRSVVFAEVIGLRPARGEQTLAEALGWLGSVEATAQTRPGLSPHAPYSTAGGVYARAAAIGVPLSTHLAELPEELELLRTRGGRLRGFLEALGAWDEGWEAAGATSGEYLFRSSMAGADVLVAHGTYLDPSIFALLRPEGGPRLAVAYCPRTTARFGHGPHPYRALRAAGAVVCLGTDSLASTSTLSILDEARDLRRRDPGLPGAALLRMATLDGAWALRLDDVAGSLRVGKSADMAVVALPGRDAADPHALVLESDLPVLATLFRGRTVAAGRG